MGARIPGLRGCYNVGSHADRAPYVPSDASVAVSLYADMRRNVKTSGGNREHEEGDALQGNGRLLVPQRTN